MLSIIVPARNAEDTLHVQLRALARQNIEVPVEVIVVDNDSTDGTAEVAKEHAELFDDFTIVSALEGHSVAYARNAGAAVASYPLLAFIDSDDEADPGWASALVEALARFDIVGARWDMTKLNTRPRGSRLVSAQNHSLQRLPYPPYLPHTGGGGMGVRKELHQRLGGFDESWALEDTDFCLRAQALGATVGFAEDALVHVRPRTELRAACRQAFRWGRTNTRLYHKFRGAHRDPVRMWCRYAASWARVLADLRHVRQGGAFERFLYRACWRLGSLSGAWRYRVPPVVG